MPLYFWGNLTRFVFLCWKVSNVSGIFAAYFVGMLLDQCIPTQNGLEARVLDLILLGSMNDFIEFLVKSFLYAKSDILATNEDVLKFLLFFLLILRSLYYF
jgi:hypothetical protein